MYYLDPASMISNYARNLVIFITLKCKNLFLMHFPYYYKIENHERHLYAHVNNYKTNKYK